MNHFTNDYIQIDTSGINLLRNGYTYKHIDYSEISTLKIRNGYLLKNRFIPLTTVVIFIGVALKILVPALFILLGLTSSPDIHYYGKGLALMIILPLSLIAIGMYFIIQSMRASKILTIETELNKHDIRIKEFEAHERIQNLTSFLNGKVKKRIEMTN